MSGRRKGYLKEKRGTLEDAPFFFQMIIILNY